MRVVLISANREQRPQPVYPLGLDCLRAVCDAAGFTTMFLDLNFDQEEIEHRLALFQPDAALLGIRNIDSIESANNRFYLPGIKGAVESIRRVSTASACPIVLGGSGFSLFPREILTETGADCGVVGPGEHVLIELLERLKNGGKLDEVPGVVYRKNGDVLINPPCGCSTIPAVANRPAELVRRYWEKGAQINVMTKRGCRLSCIYCTYPYLEGREILQRSIPDVVNEIETLQREHRVNDFYIVDSVFNLAPDTPDLFSAELMSRKLDVKWTSCFSPKGITAERLKLWKAAGLSGLEFGIDTVSDRLLPRYGKNFTVQEALSAGRACAAAGLPYSFFLLLAGPGETAETLEETVANCAKLPRAVFLVLVGMRIYPNTPLHRIAIAEGIVSPETELLTPVFYFSPQLDPDYLQTCLDQLSGRVNWIIAGYGLKEREEIAGVLRRRGRRGSLWDHCAPQD